MKSNNTQSKPVIWEKSMEIVRLMYSITGTFPKEEAEGLGRMLRNKVIQLPMFVSSATRNGLHAGSGDQINQATSVIFELDTMLEICAAVGIIQQNECDQYCEQLHEIGKELHEMGSRIQKKLKQ